MIHFSSSFLANALRPLQSSALFCFLLAVLTFCGWTTCGMHRATRTQTAGCLFLCFVLAIFFAAVLARDATLYP